LTKLAQKLKDMTSDKDLSSTPAITLEQIRAVLAEKSRAGHTAKIRDLLRKHGADKLSEIAPAEYPALLKEAEELNDVS
jgi:hypothetical protein